MDYQGDGGLAVGIDEITQALAIWVWGEWHSAPSDVSARADTIIDACHRMRSKERGAA